MKAGLPGRSFDEWAAAIAAVVICHGKCSWQLAKIRINKGKNKLIVNINLRIEIYLTIPYYLSLKLRD
jgi:hypothetical protein